MLCWFKGGYIRSQVLYRHSKKEPKDFLRFQTLREKTVERFKPPPSWWFLATNFLNNIPFFGVSMLNFSGVPSLKLTARTSKFMVGRRSFPFGTRPIFRGENVSFRESNNVHPKLPSTSPRTSGCGNLKKPGSTKIRPKDDAISKAVS